jgi:hypothetical protein
MRRLTLKEVQEQHGGVLPPDAVFRSEHDDQTPPPPKKAKGGPPRRGERFAVLNTFADFALAGLTGAEVKVWLILFRDTKKTGTARTGQSDIARRAGIDVRTVRRTLAKLERAGLVKVVRRGKLNGGPSVYRVFPTPTA